MVNYNNYGMESHPPGIRPKQSSQQHQNDSKIQKSILLNNGTPDCPARSTELDKSFEKSTKTVIDITSLMNPFRPVKGPIKQTLRFTLYRESEDPTLKCTVCRRTPAHSVFEEHSGHQKLSVREQKMVIFFISFPSVS
ncbi:unnamed protein product [Caenorhabditis nigoni]|uniref:Uncharacterized protein n=1 Tax=Caenorhabditis nigoni TaxID=1611254 RepID=A0A2G5U7R0_9PELO|nr:hypothetical protein B9Z55_014780 [Caenorhabditis nigoni]